MKKITYKRGRELYFFLNNCGISQKKLTERLEAFANMSQFYKEKVERRAVDDAMVVGNDLEGNKEGV
jgi:hypothetical protein